MTKLIFIAIFVILSLLHSWWKKRQEEQENDPADRSGQPRPQPGPRSAPGQPAPPPAMASPRNWEEELSRLLRGESAAPPAAPAPPRRPPPVPVPAPAARASVRPSPRRPVRAPQPTTGSGSDPDMDKGLPVHLPGLTQSAQAYLRASQLEFKVADRMRRVEQQVAAHKTVAVTRQVRPEIDQALRLLRDRQSQRAAFVAGVVFGPPRGSAS